MWSIPGGHADSLFEVAALEEFKEEMSMEEGTFHSFTPLAAVDQLLIKPGKDGSRQLVHYLNLVWEVSLSNEPLVIQDGDGHGVWRSFWDEEVAGLEKQGLLTPIAQIALRKSGFI